VGVRLVDDPRAEVGEDVRVRVGVGPMEFQLLATSHMYTDILWRVCHILTEPVPYAFVSEDPRAEVGVSGVRGSRHGLPRRAPGQSACRGVRGPFSSPRAGHAPLLSDARFTSRGGPLGMRACTRVRVLYMINVYTFTKLHDRRIPKVRVVVGPMEFKL